MHDPGFFLADALPLEQKIGFDIEKFSKMLNKGNEAVTSLRFARIDLMMS
jgi:hypothetical protein